jgi:hypothetical protein
MSMPRSRRRRGWRRRKRNGGRTGIPSSSSPAVRRGIDVVGVVDVIVVVRAAEAE